MAVPIWNTNSKSYLVETKPDVKDRIGLFIQLGRKTFSFHCFAYFFLGFFSLIFAGILAHFLSSFFGQWISKISITPSFLGVISQMLGFGHYQEVFRIIVLFVFVYMMYNLIISKRSTNLSFSHKKRVFNITRFLGSWVIRLPNIKIAVYPISPTLPVNAFLSFFKFSFRRKMLPFFNFFTPMSPNHSFISTKFRTIFSTAIFNIRWESREYFVTSFAYSFNHNLVYQNRRQ